MLYLIGTGGYARQIIDLCQLNELEIGAVFSMPFWAHIASENDASPANPASPADPVLAEYPVIRDFDRLTASDDPQLLLALQNNRDRKRALTVILDSITEPPRS